MSLDFGQPAQPDVVRRALVRGFTRSDLLFLGELRDVTPAAARLGFLAPVATSQAVQQDTYRLADLLRLHPAQVMRKMLLSLFAVVSGREFTQDETQVFTSPGYGSDLLVHAGCDQDEQWYLTVYTAGEDPALI